MSDQSFLTKDPLIAFLYELTRDYVSPSLVEKLIREQMVGDTLTGWVLSAPEISDFAIRMKNKLKEQEAMIDSNLKNLKENLQVKGNTFDYYLGEIKIAQISKIKDKFILFLPPKENLAKSRSLGPFETYRRAEESLWKMLPRGTELKVTESEE